MKLITIDELAEALKLLEEVGVEAMPCDTPLPLYVGKGNCGVPLEVSDDVDEMVAVPRSLVSWGMQYFIHAHGSSMKDVGIDDGDRLRVDAARTPHDGDVVVALIDREVTVKTLWTDMEGERWLVPANEAFDAISLSDKVNVKILGVVIGNEKQQPRMEMRMAQKAISRTKLSRGEPLTADKVARALNGIGGYVMLKRHWIGVYRVLKDAGDAMVSSYETFCDGVARILPHHPNLPSVRELQRMDVQSFSKPVRLWDRDNAPVDGKRFDEYVSIAQRFKRLLRERE